MPTEWQMVGVGSYGEGRMPMHTHVLSERVRAFVQQGKNAACKNQYFQRRAFLPSRTQDYFWK